MKFAAFFVYFVYATDTMLIQIASVNLKANIGQDEDFKAAREKAEMLGAKKVGVRVVFQLV